jgi:hypothetical protein
MCGPAAGASVAAGAGDGNGAGAGVGTGGGGVGVVVEQPASHPRIAPATSACSTLRRTGSEVVMWVILLEAFAAGLVFVLIVWWTMFSGRKGGERRDDNDR